MNILSFIFAIAAVVTFLLTSRGHRYATISIGLALLTAAWMVQLPWVPASQITL